MRLGKRVIKEEALAAARIVNCPLFPVGEYYCHARCPMRVGNHCVCKIVETPILCDKVIDDESGEGGYIWHFNCFHCGHNVVFFTPDENLVGSQGFCLACKARYLYLHPVMAYRTFTACLMVSRPYCKVKKRVKK